ncbi:MAG: HAMP domain-containing histidine kinase [Acidimicrobiia bacterium]|nr:HAMP domain-containing histidine kinase [Acidimicrobiia bacterium]MDH4308991.1 HAMP domain-containing histidine kinase [Acidimicrobiia bacterium]
MPTGYFMGNGHRSRALVAIAWATLALYLTCVLGCAVWGLDPWLVGGLGLIPYALLGWTSGLRRMALPMATASVTTLVANYVGPSLAGAPHMGVGMQTLGQSLLLGTMALAARARDSTDAHASALTEIAEQTDQRDVMLRMQSAIARSAAALIKREPHEAVDESMRAVHAALSADTVYVVSCARDGSAVPDSIDWFGGVPGSPQRSAMRGWFEDPAARAGLTAGKVFDWTDGDHVDTVFPIASADKLAGAVGVVTHRLRRWNATERSMVRTVGELIGAAWDREQNAARLERLLADKDRFIASVSHELRTPLAVIVGLSLEMRDDLDGFDRHEIQGLVNLVAQQSEELRDLVEDFVVSARAEEVQLTILTEEVDLAEVVPVILRALPEEVVPKVTCCDTRPPMVKADPLRLRQVIRNLIMNAHKHGGPDIRLSVGIDGAHGLLRVSDNGAGIPDENLAGIFDPYGSAAHDPGRPSTIGLGLTVARQLARLMDGEIRYGRVDGRTIFELAIPLADNQPPGAGLPWSASCRPSAQPLRKTPTSRNATPRHDRLGPATSAAADAASSTSVK